MKRSFGFLIIVLLAGASPARGAENTVVWISLDGLRNDYVQRAAAPTLTRLEQEGAYTNQEHAIFPSLTFPNHISQVTGTTVDHHGIPMNSFFDEGTGKNYVYPTQDSLIRAEPIWVTAKRQGLRVAVIDWPVSNAQTGQWKSDYFTDHYDTVRTDAQRLDQVVAILKKDPGNPPLRLIMSYMASVDHAGHSFGPEDAENMNRAVLNADAALGAFLKSVLAWFDATHSDTDDLYFIISTDHGMETMHEQVSLDRLLGPELVAGTKIVASGPMASIYFTDIPDAEKAERANQILAKLKTVDYATAWKAQDIPASYHYSDPTRIGQIVVALKLGYTFSEFRITATQPAHPGLRGMHGYDPAVSTKLLGTAIIWHYHHPMHGADLGPIVNTQWHATVARLLGIQPAPGADPRPIPLPQ
jgi:predicted AlkP superfamily pyrophosphatase or phosphodiesterase